MSLPSRYSEYFKAQVLGAVGVSEKNRKARHAGG